MMFAEPRLVVPEPVQRHRALEVVFQCDGGGLADRVERCDEDAEVQWPGGHRNSNLDRNSSSISLTSAGRSCWSQWPAPSIITSRYSPETTSRTRWRGVYASVGSAAPPMNSDGASIVAAGGGAGRFPVRGEKRKQFSGGGESLLLEFPA